MGEQSKSEARAEQVLMEHLGVLGFTSIHQDQKPALIAAMLAFGVTTGAAREGVAPRYLADRFDWAAPGDQQEDAWIVRFCDNDVRDMLFTGPDAQREAWAAWELHAPGYNMYVFRLARLGTHSVPDVREMRDALEKARDLIETIQQTSQNVWFVGADDPESAVCETFSAVNAALARGGKTSEG